MSQRSETPLNHHQEQRLLFWLWSWSMAPGGCWLWSLAMGGVRCSDTILSIGKCVGLKLITLTQHYTNLSLVKYTTHNSYDEGKHSPLIESLAMTY